MRVQQLLAQQVPAHLLQPGRVNGRNATPKQPGGLHQFGTHNPAPRFFLQVCTGVAVKLDAPCAQVNVFLFGAIAQVAQQACEHRQMQLLIAGRFAVEFPAMLGHHGVQLCVHIAPFPQAAWVDEILTQQFEVGKEIIAGRLVPIIEPEVNIKSEQKAQAEEILKTSLISHLNKLNENQTVMLKLSLPTKPNLYQDLVNHPRVLKVVALSGGYSRDDANKMLAENKGVIASFSRALTEGLSAKQSDDQFDALLDSTIQSIFDASVNKK